MIFTVYSIYSYSGIRSKKLAFTKTRMGNQETRMGNQETGMGNAHGEQGSEKKWGKKTQRVTDEVTKRALI